GIDEHTRSQRRLDTGRHLGEREKALEKRVAHERRARLDTGGGIDIDDGRRDLADQRSKRKLDLLITERNLALDLLAGRLIAAAATQQLRQRIPKARATIALSGRRSRSQHRDQYKTEKTLLHYTFASMFLPLVSHRNMYKRRKRSRPVFFHRFAPASPASVQFVPSSASVCRSGASRSS